MKVITTSSNDRVVTIEATLEELAALYEALVRKKRTRSDIETLHQFARQLSTNDPDLGARIVAA